MSHLPPEPARSPFARLFRIEALAQADNRMHGVVLLARPMQYSVLTALFAGMAATIVAFFYFGSYTRKVDVPGVLAPSRGIIKVIPAQSGLNSESRVVEGQAVQAGDIIFILSSERQTAGQVNAEQAISELLKARTTVKRYSDLAASNFVSPVQVQDKQAELLDQEQRLAELQRASAAGERDLSTAQAEARDLQVQSVRDQQAGERNVAATEQDLTENEARRQILVRASSAGTVTAITAEVGQTVGASQSLASILPAGSELEADLYAPSRAIGFLKPGMKVQMRYQAYSYQKFGQAKGHVREISRAALRPDELNLPGASATSEPVYRVRVALDRQTVPAYGIDQPLRSGAALVGSVVLEKRHLVRNLEQPQTRPVPPANTAGAAA